MAQSTPNLVAGGTIRPYRFVKISTAADDTALEADANEQVCGVTTGDTLGFDSDNHAASGNYVSLQEGDIKYVECGGNITRGGGVKSDADGKAVAVATSGTTEQKLCGYALQNGASGKVIRVWFHPQLTHPATT